MHDVSPQSPPTAGVVVLCDVRGSRRLPDRAAFVRGLESTLERVNRNADPLLGTFDLQAGLDEFAGVVRPGRAGPLLLELWEELHPVEVRFAVARGELDVVPESDGEGPPGAAGFDGPAFHRADGLLDRLRGGDRLVAIHTGAGEREDRLLTALGDLLYGRILGWTERQVEVARAYRRAGSQAAVGRELGVSQPTVSRTLAAAEYERTTEAGRAFVETLDELCEEAIR